MYLFSYFSLSLSSFRPIPTLSRRPNAPSSHSPKPPSPEARSPNSNLPAPFYMYSIISIIYPPNPVLIIKAPILRLY